MTHDDDATNVNFEPAGGWDSTDPTEIPDDGFAEDTEPTDIFTESSRYSAEDTMLDGPRSIAYGYLVWAEGGHEGRPMPLRDGTVVGRDEGDIVLGDQKVSNPHAKFRLEDGVFILWDFGSKNGTFVNREQIFCATELEENDEIRFGSSVFVLKVLKPPKKPTRRPPSRKTSQSKPRRKNTKK